jgi:glycosyltransferase involved in cell wall biosynthesis
MAVCCLDEEGAWGIQMRDNGVRVTALQRQEGFHPSLAREVAAAAHQHKADVVHAHHYSPFVYAALSRLWNPRLQVVYTEHGRLSDAPPSGKRRMANMLFARLPREVYAVSRDLKRHMVEEGFPDRRVGVIYNGIAVQPPAACDERSRVRSELGADRQTFVVGTIARLDPVKNLETMIEACAELRRSGPALLVVIGDGEERSALERVAAARPPGAVRFLGHRDDARRWLSGCDVYANSSIHEGISLTILEAMSAGLPVVATRVGGTPEIVDESCGRVVPPRSAAGMAAALTELAGDPAAREALGRTARLRVEARFTIDRMVAEYRAAYLRAVS